ncbi:hypothetical protein [Pedobacter antarcticus]|uniref:Uncharacterized protein n=2 Tax=Pedobacter antarcticus TaxID=34086 RepID=A0A081PIE6_9SPHI|nr:hypothetical protein [Pedobacter antarcticus]KEQ30469.1 hypothetical protein N180_09210 [Pedobacter antarcticus 4BY]SDM88080.1 hypothetical protein SAMN04488084_11719 [Pedobacter antarcticus]SFF37943.1 hypothetical protein SAMN03003324_03585 [Pedobacter antarcticus]
MDVEDLMPQQPENGNTAKKVSPLVSLEKDLELYNDSVREIAVEIIAEGITQYPIFVAHQHTVSIGEVILNKEELNTNWTIQASTFEEFVEKGIIKPELKELFIKNYKKPEDFMCVFVIVPEGANFIYYPYKS